MKRDAGAEARRIAGVLRERGHQAWIAGGAVRDLLLGREPKDYDLATSARPEEVQALFPKTESVGAHFGVILVKSGGLATEVATFRADGIYVDGRRPEQVTFASPEEDARRRDFTINGLFLDPQSEEIIDYVGGQRDLEAGLIRAIGDPRERFEEDGLRLLRAVRFAVQTGFAIEEGTWEALRDMAGGLRRISPERVREEFSKMMSHPQRVRALDLLAESGLLEIFFPEFLALRGCEQPPQWHPEGDVYVHTRLALSHLEAEAPLELVLAVLLHDIGKPATQTWDEEGQRFRFNGHEQVGAEMAEGILRRWRYSNRVVEEVVEMVACHMRFMHVQEMRVAKLKRFMARPTFPLELELHRVDCDSSNGFRDNYDFLQKKQEEFAREPLIPPPLVTGRDLLALGMAPGPPMGGLLERLQTAQLEGDLSERGEALERARQWIAQDEEGEKKER